jgi:uncharacterized iron-regulated membrane protein
MLCITGLPLIFHHEIDAWSKPAASSSPLSTRVTLDEILLRARAAAPDKIVQYVYQDMNHVRLWQVLLGDTPDDENDTRLLKIDAATGAVTDSRETPWYLLAIFISQPLHFGDYGGLPLKIVWALLDVATIIVLASGVYLWIKRRRQPADAAFVPVSMIQ